ncbi:hypothetical protein BEN71_03775 [Acinetobacter wuhouensis]|uniref:hypothetical protein n=1 Tax=Acinetobacter wuhouensis TaxID=1879050 RepID=UPI000839F814|nr:hypothetical protein [Acinetobacter wuhouensis]AXQ21261.1 hypothetical protein BEN71_03775 [Acinetobacter wuhouensis]
MFTLIESREEINKAQQDLERSIRRDFKKEIKKNIGYPGGTVFDAQVQSDGTYWFWSTDHNGKDVLNPRRLNWFGLLSNSSSLDISVEINTVYKGRNDRIAGFFARDSETGSVYLMHSGRVGGGTEGVGKEAFLAWSNQQPIEVLDSLGNVKEGIVVMPVQGIAVTQPAIFYINNIANFKQAVRDGELTSPEFQKKKKEFSDFYSESHGQRQGKRSEEIDYISRHGEIVDAVYKWRSANSLPDKSHLVKNLYIDLGVAIDNNLVEVYEVKTNSNRTNIYTAIGQLMVHGVSNECQRTLVLPYDQELAQDLQDTLKRLNIKLLTFKLNKKSTIIISS